MAGVEAVTPASLARATALLRRGGLVAFPTETYYGLAADPFNPAALQRLFRLKARPVEKPVLVLVQDGGQLPLLASATPACYPALMRHFWPGPLTLVFPAHDALPAELTAGTGGVGIRQSPHPVARQLLSAWGGPLTATSCNRSGQQPAGDARQAAALFPDDEGLVLDGGRTPGGAGSTVAGLRANGRLCCLREGRIPFASVERVARECGGNPHWQGLLPSERC